MADLKMTGLEGQQVSVTREAIGAFEQALQGPLLEPGHSQYDEARGLWNGMIDRRPGLIARCTGSEDVATAVNVNLLAPMLLCRALLPALKGSEEAAIVKWHKKEGDTVSKGDVLFEIETDKAVLEAESFFDGTLLKIITWYDNEWGYSNRCIDLFKKMA